MAPLIETHSGNGSDPPPHAPDLDRTEGGSVTASPAMPQAEELASIGVVLCLYHDHHGSELAGWSHAASCHSHAEVDVDGVRESIVFHDRRGRCCWRLFLLPDTHFLAWERLVLCLPALIAEPRATRAETLLLERLAQRACGEAWRASVVRLHAFRWETDFVLAISRAKPSALAMHVGLRIARNEGAIAEPFESDSGCRGDSSRQSADPGWEPSADGGAFP